MTGNKDLNIGRSCDVPAPYIASKVTTYNKHVLTVSLPRPAHILVMSDVPICQQQINIL